LGNEEPDVSIVSVLEHEHIWFRWINSLYNGRMCFNNAASHFFHSTPQVIVRTSTFDSDWHSASFLARQYVLSLGLESDQAFAG
jgi:hypothetical protein